MATTKSTRRADRALPLAPLDARWRTACLPPEERRRALAGRRPDAWLDRAIHYVDEATRRPPEDGPDPDLAATAAHAALLVAVGPTWPRTRLEALLLTELSGTAIARRTGLPGRVVVAYERLFFAVRGRRRDEATLLRRLLRPEVAAAPTERQFAHVVALFGDLRDVEDLLDALAPRPDPSRQDLATRMRIRRHVHYWTAPIEGHGVRIVPLIDLCDWFLDAGVRLRRVRMDLALGGVLEDLLARADARPSLFAPRGAAGGFGEVAG